MRTFHSGAIRDDDNNKLDYEGCLSPLAIKRYAEYSLEHSKLPDGTKRPQDNWQLGFPREEIMKSLWRHFIDTWSNHRGIRAEQSLEDSLCAMIFNAQCYLHSILSEKQR